MARLQRKKTSGSKNRKKSGDLTTGKNGAKASDLSRNPNKKQTASQKERTAVAVRSSKGKLRTYWDTGIQFLREVKTEFRKVTWPSRKQTAGLTLVVIVLVLIVSLFLSVVDYGLASLIRVLLQ